MKFRRGFVSNSSSSSFLIFGTIVDSGTISARARELMDAKEIEVPRYDDWEDNDYEAAELLSTGGLDVNSVFDTIYIGLSWDRVGDDETGKEFKARACRLINALLPGKRHRFHTHKEAWRDG